MCISIIFLCLIEIPDTSHPIIAPRVIRAIVLALSDEGRLIIILVSGRDHSMAAPVTIDSVAIVTIGLITIIFSDIDEFGLCSRGPHAVTIENRIE
jgi:hypothetical protein